ncbi:transposable element Tcb1 transposase [Trichonephila clavipes]|nr:transposable element Tcb1 transposase [Trichonephila clavipes]
MAISMPKMQPCITYTALRMVVAELLYECITSGFLIDECRIFQRLHRRLRETHSFYVNRRDAGRRRTVRSPSLVESILNVVSDRPELSTRSVAHDTSVSHQTLCSVKRKSFTSLSFSASTNLESRGLSFPTTSGWEIGSRVGRNQTTVMRIWDRWMQEGTTNRCGRSHPLKCTSSREDRQIVRMAVMDRSVTSRTVAQHIESVTHHSVSARTIRHRLQQSGLFSRRPLLGLPLAQNHRRLRRQWCDERSMWVVE